MRLRNLPCGSFPVLLSRQHLRRNTRYPCSRKPLRTFLSDRLPKRGLVVMRQSVPPLRSVGRCGRWRGHECWFLRKGCERGGEKPEREFVIRILLHQQYSYISVSAHYSNLQRIRHDGKMRNNWHHVTHSPPPRMRICFSESCIAPRTIRNRSIFRVIYV